MVEKKLIAFIDLDGTLLKEDKSISDYNRQVIASFTRLGHKVVLCSGRYSAFILDKTKQIEASDYIISDNGSLVYNYKTKEIIYENPIDENDLKKLVNYAQENKLGVIVNCFEKRYRNRYSKHLDIENTFDIENFKEKVYQVIISATDFDKANELEELLDKQNNFVINYKSIDLLLNRYNPYGYGYDLNKVGSNKGNGIVKLLEYLKIDKAQSIAIGDHYNDVSMFMEVGLKVAMDNSYSSLKDKADLLTSSNEDDGVAKILERIIEASSK